jgi:hypothetical protein
MEYLVPSHWQKYQWRNAKCADGERVQDLFSQAAIPNGGEKQGHNRAEHEGIYSEYEPEVFRIDRGVSEPAQDWANENRKHRTERNEPSRSAQDRGSPEQIEQLFNGKRPDHCEAGVWA